MKTIKNLLGTTKRKITLILIVTLSWGSYSFIDSYFEISKNLDIFATVVRELNAYYVDDIKPGDLMTKGIDGMLESLDPYTEFYPESEVEDYKVMLTGQYGGIGSLVQQKGDYVMITEPYEGFPAHKAGLMAGDIILEVNGMSVKGKTTNDVSKLLKGQANTSVKLLIQRDGEKMPIEKTLVREEIKIKNVPYSGVLNDTIGYIKLTGFTENASKEVKDALTSLKEKNHIKALVFDLRGNGGGLLREAVDIVNIFVEKGSLIVSQKGKVKEMNREHYAEKQPVDTKIPMVVLIDRGSASASEIVSGALQDLDRAVILGQRSFGKGLVQQTIQLVYNTQMKVTTAKYYTPSGRCIQALDYFHKNPDGTVDKVPDSLMKEFHTKAGRFVYDGSGIYPDVFMDARKFSNITIALANKNYIFDYATKFRAKNTSTNLNPENFVLTETEYADFLAFISDKDYDYSTKTEKELDEFKTIAENEKYFDDLQTEFDALKKKVTHNKTDDLTKNKDEIKLYLEAEIASRYFYQQGRLKVNQRGDKELKEAISLLGNSPLMKSILKGEGTYKIIGKPKDGSSPKPDDKKPNSPDPNKDSTLPPDKKPEKKKKG